MKQLFILFVAFYLTAVGCQQAMYTTLDKKCTSKAEVIKMEKHYDDLVTADPTKKIKHITMDSKVLKKLAKSSKGFKLIPAADLATDSITMYIQFWNKDGKEKYCDINSYFDSTQTGARGKKPICPPPANCELN